MNNFKFSPFMVVTTEILIDILYTLKVKQLISWSSLSSLNWIIFCIFSFVEFANNNLLSRLGVKLCNLKEHFFVLFFVFVLVLKNCVLEYIIVMFSNLKYKIRTFVLTFSG